MFDDGIKTTFFKNFEVIGRFSGPLFLKFIKTHFMKNMIVAIITSYILIINFS